MSYLSKNNALKVLRVSSLPTTGEEGNLYLNTTSKTLHLWGKNTSSFYSVLKTSDFVYDYYAKYSDIVIGSYDNVTRNIIVLIDETDGNAMNTYQSINGVLKKNLGKSAYQVALDNGFVGTESEWVNQLNAQVAIATAQATIATNKANEAKTVGFQGTWNASTNSPTLTTTSNSGFVDGAYYDVVVAGTQSITGSSVVFGIGDQVKKVGTAWVRIPNVNRIDNAGDTLIINPVKGHVPVYNGSGLWENVKDNLINYPFDVSVTHNQLLKDAIIDVELVGRNPNQQYIIGLLKKNKSESGVLKTVIIIYEWVNGSYGTQSCVFSADNYVPSTSIERIKLVEESSGIHFYVTIDWLKIPDETNLNILDYNVTGLSSLCIGGYGSSVSSTMLDNSVTHKNYPFSSDSNPEIFRNCVRDIRIFCDDMSKKYVLSTVKKSEVGVNWEIRVHEWTGDSFGNAYRFYKSNYQPQFEVETIILTSLFSSDRIEVVIDWSKIPNGFNITNQPIEISEVSTLCYRPTLLRKNRGVVAGLGDSRIDMGDNSPTGSYNPKSAFSNKQNYGLMTWAEILCDRELITMGYNFGISGERSDNILTRVDSVIQANPDICVVWAGMNDIAQGMSLSVITSNMQKIYEKLLGAGVKVVAVLDNFATNFTSSQFLLSRQLNEWIKTYVENRDNIYLIDADTVVSNPTSETPTAKSQILYDTTHIGVRGAYYLGKQLAEIFNRILPHKRTKSVGARDSYNVNYNPKQLLTNLGFSGTGGTGGVGISGTIPSGWGISRSNTGTIIESITGISIEGFPEVTLNLTSTTAEDKFSFTQNASVGLMQTSTYYKFVCEIEVINPVGLRAIGAWFETNLNDGASTKSYTKGHGLDSGQLSAGSLNETFVGYFETPIFLSPTTISQVNWLSAGIKGQFNASGSATIKIRKLKLVKL